MQRSPDLLSRFLGHMEAAGGTRPGPAEGPLPAAEIERRLGEMIAEGRAAWPSIYLPEDDFLRYLAQRLPPEEPVQATLAAVHGKDLYLACACGRGLPSALAAFERHYLSNLPAFVGHLNNGPEFADEVGQILREKLLVAAPGAQPKIADYSGRGALLNWLRIAALRTALSLRRSQNAQRIVGHGGETPEPDDDIGSSLPMRRDPEMDYIKDRYRQEFKEAFHQAFSSLSVEQRNVLRLHYVDGLNIDRIGAMFRVHRSTVARWLASSCAQVLDETRRMLRERLRLSPTEFDSLAGMVRSQLDLSILSYLRDNNP